MERDRDRYCRLVAVCRAGAVELNATMVRRGWAVDYKQFSKGRYSQKQAAAEREGGGFGQAGLKGLGIGGVGTIRLVFRMDKIDENNSPVPDADLPDLYRREAAQLRQQADVAETIEMWVMLLETARCLDRIADEREAGG